MKKYILFILLPVILFLPAPSFARLILQQTDSEQWRIEEIDNLKKEILANLKDYKIIEKTVDEGLVHIYKKHNQLQLITMSSGDTLLTYVKNWYFHKGQLIYTEQNIIENKSGEIIDTEKMYLTSYHLLSWMRSDKCVNPESVLFRKAEMDIFRDVDKLQAKYSANL